MTTARPNVRPGRALLRLGLLLAATAAGALVVGYLPTRTWAGAAGVQAMGLGVGIALLSSLAGLVPPLLTLRLAPRERVAGTLAGMALRFALMLGLLLAVLLGSGMPKLPLALWAVLAYLLLLVVDTAAVARLSRPAGRVSAP